jgi:hypothetical protein
MAELVITPGMELPAIRQAGVVISWSADSIGSSFCLRTCLVIE